MSAFVVEFENRPGELARVCEAMAARGVNIVVCGTTRGDAGTVAFIADDEAAARTALEGAEIPYAEREALTVRMDYVPGAGAAVFRKLADGINVELLLLLVRVSAEEFHALICADSLNATRYCWRTFHRRGGRGPRSSTALTLELLPGDYFASQQQHTDKPSKRVHHAFSARLGLRHTPGVRDVGEAAVISIVVAGVARGASATDRSCWATSLRVRQV